MRLELGTPVRCTDETLGELSDVVIDPKTRRVTHIVVKSHHAGGPARLVPIGLVEPGGEGEVVLRCSVGEAGRLDPVQDFAYLRMGEAMVEDPDWDVGIERVMAMPYARPGDLGADSTVYDDHVAITYDRVPKGEVEIRRASSVLSADGDVLGHVDGFVTDSGDQITHLSVKHGHLWKKRRFSVPMSAVEKVETDSVTLKLTASELRRAGSPDPDA